MSAPPVIVVGAGIGGLAAAVALAAQGVAVRIIERDAVPGGKLRPVHIGGQALDAGPTVLTMRDVFDSLFALAGERLDDHLRLKPLPILARHAWPDGSTLDLHADRSATLDAIGRFAGLAAARQYAEFCQRAQQVYQTLEQPYLRDTRPNPVSLSWRCARQGWRPWLGLMRISPFQTLWRALGRQFSDARLRQLFARYATYGGSSPLAAPATLMLIAHVEQAGVWSVEGGLYRLAAALADLARRLGVVIHCGRGVRRLLLQGGRISGVLLDGPALAALPPGRGGARAPGAADGDGDGGGDGNGDGDGDGDGDGEVLPASAVVFNGDVAALPAGLLGDALRRAVPARPPSARSLSALTWNLLTPTHGFALQRHTVFFSADYPHEFDELFKQGRLPTEPTVYVCAQDRDHGHMPGSGQPERLLCLVNAPARADTRPFSDEEIQACQTRSFQHLARLGLDLQPDSPGRLRHSPQDWAQRFPATGGALYGQATHGWRASFSRPAARCRVPGLYLAGGSTHPGAGVPMAALSGLLAARQLLSDRPGPTWTAPLHPVATPGGISMR